MRLPDHVAEIMAVLKSQGYESYLVGGCVRDLLLDRKLMDYDVVTSAPFEVICSVFPRTVPLGRPLWDPGGGDRCRAGRGIHL